MCEPTAITLGVISAIGGGMQAIGAHQAAKAQVAHQNAIATQKMQHEQALTIRRDKEKSDRYTRELDAVATARAEHLKQLNLNEAEANRALMIANRKKDEKENKAAFDIQEKLSTAIQSQGKMLATGLTGQSFLLQTEQAEREFGQAAAAINASMFDANLAYGLDVLGVQNDLVGANAQAYNQQPADPISQQASMGAAPAILASGPSSLSLVGGLIGAGAQGASVGYSTAASMKELEIGKYRK